MDNDYLIVEIPQLSFHGDLETSVTEVTVRGEWDDRLRSAVSQGLRACLAETPCAVVVDLTHLVDHTGMSLPTWRTAARYGALRQPPVDVVLTGVPEALRRRIDDPAMDGAVRTARTLPEARARARHHRWTRHRQLSLPADAHAAALGRALAADACREWGLSPLLSPARLILNELIINAVEHAGTDLLVSVSVRGDLLHLAVQDDDPMPPRLLEHDPDVPGGPVEQRGAGLRTVRSLATSWGARPRAVGKVVWACMTSNRTGAPHDPWRRHEA